MKKKAHKAFIVEGERREVGIIKNLEKNFFDDEDSLIITLPAGENIYMLWKQLKEDDFETDLIEVLKEGDEKIRKSLEGISRDDFSEVFLFFDHDAHQNNLSSEDKSNIEDVSDIMESMLESFDNETENGKLYISYPMVEALRDFGYTDEGEEWFYKVADYSGYRKFSARRGRNTDFRKYSPDIWRMLIKEFVEKISFLWETKELIEYEEYTEQVDPATVYKKQRQFGDGVLVLSAFPEFLLDYFKEEFWEECIYYSSVEE